MKLRNPHHGPVWKISHMSLLFWLILFTLLLVMFKITTKVNNVEMPFMQNIKIQKNDQGFLINTEGCKIPDFPIATRETEKYFKYKFDVPHCNKNRPPLVDSNLTSLFTLKESFQAYNISNSSDLHCCYEELKRKIPHGSEADYLFEYKNECVQFQDSVMVPIEFVHVKCNYSKETIYEDFFAFVPKKINSSNSDKISVLMIGLDAISRLNFHRQMPRTSAFLKKINFQEFFGYNKVADNTYPNLLAILTGKNEKTIDKTCKKSNKYYDDCPFIWKNFKNNSYVTSFAEDAAWMGIFTLGKKGFQKQPTDYMWGFFDRVAEKTIGNLEDKYILQCIGSRESYKMIANYCYDFISQMKTWKLPYFSLFWSSNLSHDNLNKPRKGDEFYYNLFKKMFNEGHFGNTVVIVLSDHGIRYGSFRQTYQGSVEERLPFLFIRLPKEFTSKFKLATSNLISNTRKLTSPYDLHETLYDLSVPHQLEDEFIAKNQRISNSKFGKSLFGRIETTRTCEDCGISDHWCTCLASDPIEITSEITFAAKFVVDHLNGLLKGYAECAELKLKEIKNALLLSHSKAKFGSKKSFFKDFMITFETEPGNAPFEATVRKYSRKNDIEVLGSVSRLNLYGNQSSCTTDFHLKLYCFCKKYSWH